MDTVAVPCGSCKLCCQNFTVVVVMRDQGDDPETFETDGDGDDLLTLKHKPNGDCIYLGEDGCTIHDRAPTMCRVFDCREQHAMYSRKRRRIMLRAGLLSKDVLRRGNELRKARDREPKL